MKKFSRNKQNQKIKVRPITHHPPIRQYKGAQNAWEPGGDIKIIGGGAWYPVAAQKRQHNDIPVGRLLFRIPFLKRPMPRFESSMTAHQSRAYGTNTYNSPNLSPGGTMVKQRTRKLWFRVRVSVLAIYYCGGSHFDCWVQIRIVSQFLALVARW